MADYLTTSGEEDEIVENFIKCLKEAPILVPRHPLFWEIEDLHVNHTREGLTVDSSEIANGNRKIAIREELIAIWYLWSSTTSKSNDYVESE